jgi:peptide/nickel transport system substrate-binding protein
MLSGCGLEIFEQPAEDTEKSVEYLIVENGEISVPLTGFNDLNPLLIDNLDYYYFSKLIFEGLFEYDKNMEPIPQLASTYTIDEDGRRIEVFLRDDVYWHNGDLFTADDVVHTFNALVAAKEEGYLTKLLISSVRGNVDLNFIKIKKTSEKSVEVILKEPIGNWKDLLTFPIVSRSTGNDVLKRDGYIPIGTGPFKYRDYIKYKEVKLVANPAYRGGTPQIARINGKIFEDERIILTAFETGKLSMARNVGSDWDKYDHLTRIKFYEYVSDELEFMAFNKERFEGEEGLALKKAIMYSVDRQSIIDKVFLQHATQTDTPVHPDSYLSDQSCCRYGYSKENALYELSRTDSYEVDPMTEKVISIENGEELTLRLLVDTESRQMSAVTEIIRNNLVETGIGIEIVNLVPLKDETRSQALFRIFESGDYDIALLNYSLSVVPEYKKMLLELNALDELAEEDDFNNSVDDVYNFWGDDDRTMVFRKFQDSFAGNLPFGTLYFKNRVLMVDSEIMGPLEPSFNNLYRGLEKCFLAFYTD